ncbi:hypothetical protein, partial [Nostoc linckia]
GRGKGERGKGKGFKYIISSSENHLRLKILRVPASLRPRVSPSPLSPPLCNFHLERMIPIAAQIASVQPSLAR